MPDHTHESICDACGDEMHYEEAETCGRCGGTFCEAHIGELDHECEGDS